MKEVKAEIITIGDEILYGHILDTNSQWLCQELGDIGIRVIHRLTIGDNEQDILQAFQEAWNRSDLTIITGGLGPTPDDLTKPCLANFFRCGMATDAVALEEVTNFFRTRGKELSDINREQAVLPTKAQRLSNPMGTAPGMWFEKDGRVFVSLPGVPLEMKYLVQNEVITRLRKIFELPVIYHKVVKTAGIGESFLAEKISGWERALPDNIRLAYLPSLGMVKLRLTSLGQDLTDLQQRTELELEKLRQLVGRNIYGYDGDELESVVGSVLRDRKLTISAAESCTGGFLSHMLTRVEGSSDYFMGAVVSYDNSVKMGQLGVKEESIAAHGAVSEEVVREMAEGVRKHLGADIGVAITGVAGPGGGTEEKPVGTVWICYSDGARTISKKLSLGFRDRVTNIRLSALAVLNLIRLQLMYGD